MISSVLFSLMYHTVLTSSQNSQVWVTKNASCQLISSFGEFFDELSSDYPLFLLLIRTMFWLEQYGEWI